MSDRPLAVVNITFEPRSDGGIYIYSDDVPGLHISATDIAAAMRDVIPVIKALFKLNAGVDVDIQPEVGVEALLSGNHRATVSLAAERPLASTRRFVMTLAEAA